MKYFVVLSLMLSAQVGFSKSVVTEKNLKQTNRAPAAEDGAAPAPLIVITMDKKTYQILHPDAFVPDCEVGEVLLSNGKCGPNPFTNVSPSDDWDKWVDTRKSEYCYHVKEVHGRVYDAGLLLSTAQKAFDKWEDNLHDNMESAQNDHLGAPRFRSCEDCGVCDRSSDDGSGFSGSVSRNIIKSFGSEKARPENIRRPPKAPGGTIRFRY